MIRMDSKSNNKCPYKEHTEERLRTRRGVHVKTEAKTRVR